MQGKMMIELNYEEATVILRLLKAAIQTDAVVKAAERMENRIKVHEAAIKGCAGDEA